MTTNIENKAPRSSDQDIYISINQAPVLLKLDCSIHSINLFLVCKQVKAQQCWWSILYKKLFYKNLNENRI